MHQAKTLLRELKKFKVLFLEVLSDPTLERCDYVLGQARHLRFEIKEHKQVKEKRFELKEKEELRQHLAKLSKMKSVEGDLSEMRTVIERAAYIDFKSVELE